MHVQRRPRDDMGFRDGGAAGQRGSGAAGQRGSGAAGLLNRSNSPSDPRLTCARSGSLAFPAFTADETSPSTENTVAAGKADANASDRGPKPEPYSSATNGVSTPSLCEQYVRLTSGVITQNRAAALPEIAQRAAINGGRSKGTICVHAE